MKYGFRLVTALAALVLLAGSAQAENITKTFDVYLDDASQQFHARVSEMNALDLRFNLYSSGTNRFDCTGKTISFMWSTNRDPSAISSMWSKSGTAYTNYCIIPIRTNDLWMVCQGGYAVLKMTDATYGASYARGYISIADAPEFTGTTGTLATTALDWSLYSYTSTANEGPVRPDNSTILCTTNADGSITLVASGVAGVSWASVSAKPAIITDLVASNGSRIAILNAGSLTGVVANARLDADLQKLAGNDAGSLTNIPAANLAGTVANARLDADLQTLAVNNAGALTNIPAANLAGNIANARLDVDLQKLAGNDGGSLTNLNGSAITSGTLPTARLAAALQTLAGNDGGNLTNLVESDTLQTVANRGAGATNELTLSGGVNMGGASITNVSTLGGSGVPNIIQLATSSSFDFQSSPVYGLGGANLAGATNLDHGTGLVGKGDDDHPQ